MLHPLSNLQPAQNYFGDGTRVPRLVETSLVMLVSTKDACSSQRRVLHARPTRWKNESKYRACGAGGPDKIKQLFPRFIGSAVNRHDRFSRFASSSPPSLPRNAFFSGVLARTCNTRNSGK